MLKKSIKDHLISRKMDTSLYHIIYGDDSVYFLLFNLSGQLCGYQEYSPGKEKIKANKEGHGKYYTFLTDNSDIRKSKMMTVWGMETWNRSKNIFVTEGIFDAVHIHNLGYAAIAILTSTPSKQLLNWMGMCGKTFIAICDGDHAGKKLLRSIGKGFCCPEGEDLDDFNKYELKKKLQEYINV